MIENISWWTKSLKRHYGNGKEHADSDTKRNNNMKETRKETRKETQRTVSDQSLFMTRASDRRILAIPEHPAASPGTTSRDGSRTGAGPTGKLITVILRSSPYFSGIFEKASYGDTSLSFHNSLRYVLLKGHIFFYFIK